MNKRKREIREEQEQKEQQEQQEHNKHRKDKEQKQNKEQRQDKEQIQNKEEQQEEKKINKSLEKIGHIYYFQDQHTFENALIIQLEKSINNYETALVWRTSFRMSLDRTIKLYTTFSSFCKVIQQEKLDSLYEKYIKVTKSKILHCITNGYTEKNKTQVQIRIGDKVLFEYTNIDTGFSSDTMNFMYLLNKMISSEKDKHLNVSLECII